jgi:uncharacterized membrane protein
MQIFLVIFIILLILDISWLSFSAPRLYLPGLGKIGKLRPFGTVTIAIGFLTYLLLAYGIRFYVFGSNYKNKTMDEFIIDAALLGFISYSMYNLTNLATFEDYSSSLALTDIMWGTSVTLLTSLITLGIISK